MAERVRDFDWSRTPLGPMRAWPDELRVAVDVCLNSRFPMFVWWGPGLINIYNDAYVPMLGQRHPSALGRPARDSWDDIWDVVGPQADAVMSRGEATWNERVRLVMERKGYREDTYFTWSYSPIRERSGRVVGLFCAVTEETERVRAEAERDRLAAQRQLALDAAHMGWWHYDPLTRVASYDARYAEIFGVTGSQRPNEEILRRLHPEDLPRVWAKVEAALNPVNPQPYAAEYRIVLDDGSVRWVEAHGRATFDGEGPARHAASFVGTVVDVTERKLAEEQPRRILESITDAFFAVDRDWRFTYVNLQAERVLGRQPGDLLGKTLWGEYPGLRGTDFERAYRRAADERVATSVTAFYPDHDRWYEIHAYPAPGGGISVYFRDVTDRQQWVTTLAETRRKLDSALIAGEVGTFEWDVTNDRLWGDPNFERIFGIRLDGTGAAPIGTYVAAIHAADRDRVLERVRRSVETGCDYEVEYRITSTMPPRWVIARGKVERDPAGGVVRFPGVVLDVTEQKRAEQMLAAQNRAMELLAGGAPLPEALAVLTGAVEEHAGGQAVASILLVDDDGCSLRTGAAPSLPPEYNAAIDGIKAAVGLGTCADAAARNEIVVTPDLAAAPSWRGLSHLPLALGLRAAWSMPIRASDGRVLGTFGTYFRECREPSDGERQAVKAMCRVAALAVERRRAEVALRESEERFRQLADAMPQMVWVTRPDGHHEYYNRRWYEFTGVPQGSTDGDGWNGMFHPDDRDRAWAVWRNSLATGEPYEIEYRLRHHGGDYRWVLGRALPVRNERGDIERWFGTCTDVDAMKGMMAEREQLLASERAARAEAERAGRMKDEFLSVLSHELRTPLNAILGWSHVLIADGQDEQDLAEGLRTIERNARAQTQIINDLLDMSRIVSGKVRLDVQRVELAPVVRAAVDTVRPAADAKGVRLQLVLDPLAGPVSGDPNRLQQVFWNLLSNAIKFTARGGRVQVLLERVNSHLEVSVIDTGDGIRPDFLPHVFDRFRQADATTTRRHGGLGLGLAIAKQLVELHGGTIRAASAGEGRGATFTVALPLTVIHPSPERAPDVRHPESPAPAPDFPDFCRNLSGLKVLVVDDEPDARALIRRLLEECDAFVHTAATAAEGVALVESHRPDVLVSDIGMPGEDGYSLIHRVRALGPERGGKVPALALTAYARAEDRMRAIGAGYQMHVAKPVEPAELIMMVAGLAGKAGPDFKARR